MPRAERYGSGGLLVFDTSAWVRQRTLDVLPRWVATAQANLLVVCPVVALELLASARDQGAFDDLDQTLAALPAAPVTRAVGEAAIGVSRELGGRRRIPAADYLIANKYTSPQHFAITGRSNGGLLMGASTKCRASI